MHILFYFPTNQRSVALETWMEEFSHRGLKVWLSGRGEKGDIHDTVETHGVKTETHSPPSGLPSILTYLWYIVKLRKFIKERNIDLIYSHTQPVNFVSVFTQFLVRARFIICRHHSDYIMKCNNAKAKRFDRIINKPGKEFIVPSKKVFHQITEIEGVDPAKVRQINYACDLEAYSEPDEIRDPEIQKYDPAQLRLCSVSRFIPCKRYDKVFDCVGQLAGSGFDLCLPMLGNGPLEEKLKAQVHDLGLEQHIHFIGFTTEVINSMAASDMIVHFFDSEGSNSVIKEAGLIKKLVSICQDVGDFDEDIEPDRNGFVQSKDRSRPDFTKVVEKVYARSADYKAMGEALREHVMKHFSFGHVIYEYNKVL